MHCCHCGHPLWNLAEARCPGCGSTFDLRNYHFELNTVAFACPYCGAQHTGAGPHHLPATQGRAYCQGCEQVMEVQAMRVLPLVDHARGIPLSRVPWDRRRSFESWWRTCLMSMTRPRVLGASFTTAAPMTAYLFAVLAGFLVALGQLLGTAIAMKVVGLPGSGAGPRAVELLEMSAIFWGIAVPCSLAAPLIVMGLIAAPAHLLLMASGPHRGKLPRTALSILYGHGPLLIAILPLCNFSLLVAGVWSVVSTIFILRSAQQVSGKRATMAVLVPVMVLGGGCLAVTVMATVIAELAGL